jgi:hypothetical protein
MNREVSVLHNQTPREVDSVSSVHRVLSGHKPHDHPPARYEVAALVGLLIFVAILTLL